jgi:uncharacterized tellurite resistance protein B-like protein
MLQRILDVLRAGVPGGGPPPEGASADTEYDQVLAVGALLVEMALIDGEFSPQERQRITSIMRSQYGIEERDIESVMEKAERAARQATSYWELTSVVNANYSSKEKLAIVELLWCIVYADGTVEKHEDYLVKKLARLLNVSHAEMIAAKLRARPR